MENPIISAEMIEAKVFLKQTMRYNVTDVLQSIINDGPDVVLGAVPAEHFHKGLAHF
jgi:hypothetical protein